MAPNQNPEEHQTAQKTHLRNNYNILLIVFYYGGKKQKTAINHSRIQSNLIFFQFQMDNSVNSLGKLVKITTFCMLQDVISINYTIKQFLRLSKVLFIKGYAYVFKIKRIKLYSVTNVFSITAETDRG